MLVCVVGPAVIFTSDELHLWILSAVAIYRDGRQACGRQKHLQHIADSPVATHVSSGHQVQSST